MAITSSIQNNPLHKALAQQITTELAPFAAHKHHTTPHLFQVRWCIDGLESRIYAYANCLKCYAELGPLIPYPESRKVQMFCPPCQAEVNNIEAQYPAQEDKKIFGEIMRRIFYTDPA